MRLLLFSVLMLTGCTMRSYTRTGDKAVCLIDYQHKTISCDFETLHECREDYIRVKNSQCILKTNTKGAKVS